MTPITGVVITLNEEKQIADCIRSLFRVCDEVIVVDSLSQDDTVRIAEAEGAREALGAPGRGARDGPVRLGAAPRQPARPGRGRQPRGLADERVVVVRAERADW